MNKRSVIRTTGSLIICGAFALLALCSDNDKSTNAPANVQTSKVAVVPLTSDTSTVSAVQNDPNLVNAWGLAFDETGNAWVCSNGKGLVLVLDTAGREAMPPIAVPARDGSPVGSPTGIVVATNNEFVAGVTPVKVVVCTEDGLISVWSTGTMFAQQAHGDSLADYKGLASARRGDSTFLYATNFRERRIDVYTSDFRYRKAGLFPFADSTIPSNFGPFNIANINNELYVSYAALQGPDNVDDSAGPGNGFIDVYNPDGTLLRRFASDGDLNSPWGMVKATAGFGTLANQILVGNFGDGHITVFDNSGNTLGQIMSVDSGSVVIDGLWALAFPRGISGSAANRLYFTAGPADETHGLFGYMIPR
jgi:uncharacterized protein (TIGR03118 family)